MTSSFTSMTISAALVLLGDAPDRAGLFAAAAQSVPGRQLDAPAELAAHDGRLVYLGSGPLAALAQESALTLLELTAGRVVSFQDSSPGFGHGPKAVPTGQALAAVFISTDPYTRSYDLDVLTELRLALGPARVLAVAAGVPEGIEAIALPGLQGIEDGYVAVVYILVAQILALPFSLRHGLTTDDRFPGRAANRVVKGVRIHDFDSAHAAGER